MAAQRAIPRSGKLRNTETLFRNVRHARKVTWRMKQIANTTARGKRWFGPR